MAQAAGDIARDVRLATELEWVVDYLDDDLDDDLDDAGGYREGRLKVEFIPALGVPFVLTLSRDDLAELVHALDFALGELS